jgi:hypothetical protein
VGPASNERPADYESSPQKRGELAGMSVACRTEQGLSEEVRPNWGQDWGQEDRATHSSSAKERLTDLDANLADAARRAPRCPSTASHASTHDAGSRGRRSPVKRRAVSTWSTTAKA